MATFQQPGISSPEDKFAPNENNGALLLFFPTTLQQGVKTAHGETDAVGARVVRLNDGRVWDNAMIFSIALVTQLRGAVPDGMVLGTLGQGENTKGNPPWLLRPHTEAEVARAEQWLAANPRIQQAAAPAAPPTPPAWNAPATPAAPQWGGQASAAPAPQAGGWQQAAPAPAQQGGWGAPAPAAPSAPPVAPAPPAGPPADPGLVAALTAKGCPVPPGISHEDALKLWALYGG